MKLNSREKLLVLLLLIFGLVLIGKSLTEGYRLTAEVPAGEEAFYNWVQEEVAIEYSGGFYKSGIFSIKLISIKERNQEGQVYYVAKLRKYVLNVVPFSDVFIKEEQSKFIEESIEVK